MGGLVFADFVPHRAGPGPNPKGSVDAQTEEAASYSHSFIPSASLFVWFITVAYDRADRYLRMLADKRGGRSFYAVNKSHLASVFSRIAQELREQYSLGYYPGNSDGNAAQRSIKLKVDAPDVVVRARRTYLYRLIDASLIPP